MFVSSSYLWGWGFDEGWDWGWSWGWGCLDCGLVRERDRGFRDGLDLWIGVVGEGLVRLRLALLLLRLLSSISLILLSLFS